MQNQTQDGDRQPVADQTDGEARQEKDQEKEIQPNQPTEGEQSRDEAQGGGEPNPNVND
jgi:hypothetical protein